MKKTIYFIRTAPYSYKIKDFNLYKSFDFVARKKVEVSILKAAVLPKIFNFEAVYCSPRLRSIQTAKLFTKKPKIKKLLSEVDYKMGDFISEKDFFDKDGKPNVNKARKAFVNGLINNRLQESYKVVITRIENIWQLIRQSKEEEIVIVSHGFFLKIIEAYVRDPSIKKNPSNLLKYFDGTRETFHFCEGFKLTNLKNEIKFNSYIKLKKGK